MGEAESGSKVSLNYSNKGFESWGWRFGQINSRIEDLRADGRDWTDQFWDLVKHCAPYLAKETLTEWWNARHDLDADEKFWIMVELQTVADKIAWQFNNGEDELL